jgi:hypothetical protein
VTPSTSGVPTGDVVFSNNGTSSLSIDLDSTGSASYTTATLTTGTHGFQLESRRDHCNAASIGFKIVLSGTPTLSTTCKSPSRILDVRYGPISLGAWFFFVFVERAHVHAGSTPAKPAFWICSGSRVSFRGEISLMAQRSAQREDTFSTSRQCLVSNDGQRNSLNPST